MRRLLLVALVLLLSVSSALAHPGRTDSNGGHWDHSTGEYHFHHGYSAHQHPDGVCPYAKPAATSAPKNQAPKPSSSSHRTPLIAAAAVALSVLIHSVTAYRVSVSRERARKRRKARASSSAPSGEDQSRVSQSLVDDLARMDSQEFYRKDSGHR